MRVSRISRSFLRILICVLYKFNQKSPESIIKKPSFQETVYGNLLPQVEQLKTFDSLEEAKKAGLKSGDMFRGPDGKTYKVN